MDQPLDYPKPSDKSLQDVINVPVNKYLLRLAMARTGIEDSGELVLFALRLLTDPDPSDDFIREMRGSLPGFDLDV
jgi:hypothetical protein